MNIQKFFNICLLGIFLLALYKCDNDYLLVPQKPKPRVGNETDSLEAFYKKEGVPSVNDPFWKEANFLSLTLQDLNIEDLYQDGLLNMTGTYNGLNDFNRGVTPTIQLRAAYDDEYLYILAEWDDITIDVSRGTWLWDGPSDPLKSDSANGWTGQRNDDKIAFAFDLSNASSSAGTFTNVGCAASCHHAGTIDIMSPEMGSVDIWNWSLALSEPFGYAFDMVSTADNGLAFDAGQKSFIRNSINPLDFRFGPQYEWDGQAQEITKSDGSHIILDPAFFLLNKTSFTGDPSIGAKLYKDPNKGCFHCHGENGEGGGDFGDGPAFTSENFTRKFSRTTLDDFASQPDHTGYTYYTKLSNAEKENIIAFVRGFGGIPGYTLKEPVAGESINDVTTISNTKLVKVQTSDDHTSTYKVLFIRKLNTGKSDDVQFDPQIKVSYVFGVALMDNDGKNHIGSLMETLRFIKP